MKAFIQAAFIACFSVLGAQAQNVLFNEDFSNISGNGSGAGNYSFPSGWLLRNVDNRAPNVIVAYVNDAWERREDFYFNVGDSAMFSTSFYNPIGAADDWAWTPPITLTNNNKLSWRGVSYDPANRDGYEVRIMTQSSTPGGPTGGWGAIGNQITNSTQLFVISAENSAWTTRSVDLSTYAGETVWIAFRNNTIDKFLLLIDDVKVYEEFNYDAELKLPALYEYSIIPTNHATQIPLHATISSNGGGALSNVVLHAEILNSSNTIVHSATSAPVNLAVGASQVFSLPSYNFTSPDTYSIRYFATMNEIDQNISNDSVFTSIIISDTTYARDRGAMSGNIGIGAGNGGYIGNEFKLNVLDTITSVSLFINKGFIGERLAAVVWDKSGGFPSTIIATTDTIIYTDSLPQWYTLKISSPSILNSGDYVVTAVEFPGESTIKLGQTLDIFTNGKMWVNWPTSPSGNWSNLESFGASYSRALMVRPNFGVFCNDVNYTQNINLCFGDSVIVGTSVYKTDGQYTDVFAYGFCDSIVTTHVTTVPEIIAQVSLSSDFTSFSVTQTPNATYQWIDCATGTDIVGATSSMYSTSIFADVQVEVTLNGCLQVSSCISNTGVGLSNAAILAIDLFPNPTNELLNIQGLLIDKDYSMQIMDINGRILLAENKLSSTTIDVSNLKPGVYILMISSENIPAYKQRFVKF